MISLRAEGRSFAIGTYLASSFSMILMHYTDSLLCDGCVAKLLSIQVIPRGYCIKQNIYCALIVAGESDTELAVANDLMHGELSPLLDAAISLPNSLFELINSRSSSSLVFARYNESTLFPIDGGRSMNSSTPRQTVIGTDILAATVVGETFTDLEEDMKVTVMFRPKIPDGKVC